MIFAALSLSELVRQIDTPLTPSASAEQEVIRRYLAGDLIEVDEEGETINAFCDRLGTTSADIEALVEAFDGTVEEQTEILASVEQANLTPKELDELLEACAQHSDPVAILRRLERHQNAINDLAFGHDADLEEFGELNPFTLEKTPMSPALETALINFLNNTSAVLQTFLPGAGVLHHSFPPAIKQAPTPSPAPVQVAAPAAIEQAATEDAKPIEYGDVSAAVFAAVKRVGQPAVLAAFAPYGIKSAKELAPEKFAEFVQTMEALNA